MTQLVGQGGSIVETKVCQFCGTVFPRTYHRNEKWRRIQFCSHKCYHSNMRGGEDRDEKPKICETCGESFDRREVSAYQWSVTRFCSRSCYYAWRIKTGQVQGRNSPTWKEDAGYDAIHQYVGRWWTKTGFCERCGVEAKTQWANLDGKYDRFDRSSWAELCTRCHGIEDAHLQPRGEDHKRAVLIESQVKEIRIRHHDGGEAMRYLAREYGVNRATIKNVVRGKTWAHVEWDGF